MNKCNKTCSGYGELTDKNMSILLKSRMKSRSFFTCKDDYTEPNNPKPKYKKRSLVELQRKLAKQREQERLRSLSKGYL